ncbi:MAG: hypothetical protein HZA27_03725, partial [Candidatus Omnitrophica bacterium]|nr:hypothetical protein [Candidatus Omnitrophota bacterium]
MINILTADRLKDKILFLLYISFIVYLVMNTGIISDDFEAMAMARGLEKPTNSPFYFIDTPFEQITHYPWYHLFSLHNQNAVNISKILYVIISFYLIVKFFTIYLKPRDAFLISFLFVFFPTHDATVYFFMGQYLTLSFAFYLYAYYLGYHNRLVPAFLFSLMGSFISYGSLPIAVGLFFLFSLNRKLKQALVILVPNLLFTLYYIFLTKFLGLGTDRLAGQINFLSIIKNFIIQIITFFDSAFGPAFWLKIYYALKQMSGVSLIIGLIAILICQRIYRKVNYRYDSKLIISMVILLLTAFFLYSLTGMYPELAFNLGNRTTIFGSFLLTYLIFLMPVREKLRILLLGIFIFAILGISNHWRSWNLQQQRVIHNIMNNKELNNYNGNEIIYVSGNQYSKYGPFSHIEFLSEHWVTIPVFKLAVNKNIVAKPFNRRHKYEDGYLFDLKYKKKIKINRVIKIYDSQKDLFFDLDSKEINSYIAGLPVEYRHWLQVVKLNFLTNLIIKYFPRLEYALSA